MASNTVTTPFETERVSYNFTTMVLLNDGNTTDVPAVVQPPLFKGYPPYGRALPLLRHSVAMTAILSAGYILVLLLAIFNNSLVVSVIWRNPNMRNVTNYFLANLAVADITVSFLVLPITLLSNLLSGKYNE